MRTIWKFPLQLTDRQVIPMPPGAHILTAQMQGDTLCIWAIIEPDSEPAPPSLRAIWIVGTGNPMPPSSKASLAYISTVQMHGGALVWHVFEESKERQT